MCATWLHKLLGVEGSVRISLGFWNTEREIEQLAEIANKIAK
jgi:selenocysteine lyase/cysteine desulfurase